MKKRFISIILAGAAVLGSSFSAMASQQEYTVKKGDTLWAIAQAYNTTFMKLAEINSIENPDIIFPGQVIKTVEAANENVSNTESVTEESLKQ